MKSLQATDIVPLAVLYKIAQKIRKVAAEIGVSKTVPDMSATKIGIPAPKITQNQIQISLTLNQLHSAYEWGSGIHRTRGTPAKYPIVPVNAKRLVFEGTNAYEGKTIFTDLVMHPGVKARPFLEPAKRQTRQENLQTIRENATKNIRLIVVGMSRKI